MEKEPKSREGIKGWINPAKYGKFGIERFAWILMRITGLGLLAYFIAHIYDCLLYTSPSPRDQA